MTQYLVIIFLVYNPIFDLYSYFAQLCKHYLSSVQKITKEFKDGVGKGVLVHCDNVVEVTL